jgi:hypothetical protein
MIFFAKILGFYFGLAVLAVYAVWLVIGYKGFDGLSEQDSRLAKLFTFAKHNSKIKFPHDTAPPAATQSAV